MLISRKNKFIFIHVYKNAGTSITKCLLPFCTNRVEHALSRAIKKTGLQPPFGPQPFKTHIHASDIIARMGQETYDSFFSFAIVRNPWSWQVSLYTYMLKHKPHPQHEFVGNLESFDNYIKWRCTHEVKLQRDFIYSKDEEKQVDYIGRFETLETDFSEICSRVGISASLPVLNVSNTKRYQDFYNDETRELVSKTFADDIRLFNYSFDED